MILPEAEGQPYTGLPENEAVTAAPEKNGDARILYLFSGLGADERAFEHLVLPGYKKVFIQWIPPEPDESMPHYAQRIRAQINTPDPVLIGLSFGGMMAVEVAKQIPVRKLVLISSAKTRADLAAGSNLFFRWELYKIIPGSMLQQSNFMVNRLFGAKSAADKKLLAAILEDTDVSFFRWAMDRIVSWENDTVPPHLLHIHGTADRIIPFSSVHADVSIEDGGHLMILNRADTISKIILDYLGPGTN